MMNSRTIFFAVLAVFTLFAPRVSAQDNWKAMLAGLQEKHYYDTALDYIASQLAKPNFPAELKEVADYQIGMVHLNAFESGRSSSPPDFHLEEARKAFTKFANAHPNHQYAYEANFRLGTISFGEGKILLERSADAKFPENQRNTSLAQARQKLDDALKSMSQAEKIAQTIAKTRRDDANASEEDKLEANGRFIGSRYTCLLIRRSQVDLLKPDTADYKKAMQDAVNAFETFGKTYGSTTSFAIPAYMAKMEAAKGYYELGNLAKTREILSEVNVLGVDSDPAVAPILIESLILRLKIDQGTKDYPDALERVSGWVSFFNPNVHNSEQAQLLNLDSGKIMLEFRGTMKKTDDANKYAELTRLARTTLSRIPANTKYFMEAQALMVKAGIGGREVDENPADGPMNYLDALELAEKEWSSYMTARQLAQLADDANSKEQAERQVKEAMDATLKAVETAIAMKENEYLRFGLPKADDPSSGTDLFNLRSYRLEILFSEGKFLEAGILGEFLATRYSGNQRAVIAAQYALRGYYKAFIDARAEGEDGLVAAKCVARMADFIMKRWDMHPAAQNAMVYRIDVAIETGKIEDATAMISDVPEDKTQRAEGEMRLGFALWSRYRNFLRLEENERPPQSELDTQREAARKHIDLGLTLKLKSDTPVNTLTVSAVYTLAQIEIGEGNSQKALDWLNNPKAGPLALAKAASLPRGVELSENMITESMTVALRAYVDLQKLDEAEATMAGLEKLVAQGGGDSGERLTRIYISLGRQLEERLNELRISKDTKKIDELTEAFLGFLGRIKSRENLNFQSLYWIADTYYRFGAAMLGPLSEPPPEARKHFMEAIASYAAILTKIKTDPAWAPPKAAVMVNLRLAELLRALGQYEKAMERILDILKESESSVETQIEAAKTYQAWGKKEPKYYVLAVTGGEKQPNGRNLVWGWIGLIQRTARGIESNPQLKEIYFDAQYNRFQCMVDLARTEADKGKRDTSYSKAEAAVLVLYRTQPEMGGPEWFRRFDTLFKRIRTFRGAEEIGLKKAASE